jgi:uncharacterized RDD family membrane protein YckC
VIDHAPARPAGLLVRAAAFGLDYLVIAAWILVVVGLGLGFRAVAPDAAAAVFSTPLLGQLFGFLVLTLPVTLYFALSERTPAGGTWGKRRLRLRVATRDGARIGLGRSLARSALKFLPWELAHGVIWQFSAAGPNLPPVLTVWLTGVWVLVGLNVVSVLVDRERRALYDLVAGTIVVRSQAERGPSAA